MMGIGITLIVLLVGKAIGQRGWKNNLNYVENLALKQMSKCLELLWNQNYPAAAGTFDDRGGKEREHAGRAGRYLDAVFRQFPLYRYLTEKENTVIEYEESDPSYQTYCDNQKFYQEHEYLLRYGDEGTNQEIMASSDTGEGSGIVNIQPDGSLAQAGSSMNTAHAVKSELPVVGTSYVKEQLADYDFLMKHFYSVHTTATAGREMMNADEFLSKDFTLSGGSDQPQILIYHTHSQETFADFGPDNPDATVLGMGNYLSELLTKKGYNVIHDTSVYDLRDGKLDRNKAYTYALEGVTAILQKYPSVEVVLDLHRDGVSEKLHLVSEVNGKQTAPIMFFNGVSQTPDGPIEYLPNPYRQENLAFSFQMQLNAAAYYPGLTRKIYIKGLRYNLHLRPRSALIEVGAQTNTYQEVLNAMEPLSELLDMVLQGN